MDIGNNVTLTLYDTRNNNYPITDAYGLKWSNHYSDSGSGFGFLTFNLKRQPGINHKDIGFGYKVRLVKGLRLYLFYGIVVKNEEDTDGTLTISALGWSSILSFDVLNTVLSDNRTNRWVGGCTARGSFRPDKFDHAYSWTTIVNDEEISYDGLQLTPRRGVYYNQDDYHYLRYRFEFGDIAKRLTGQYQVSFPNNWPGRVGIYDAAENLLWSSDISSNGTLDLDLYSHYSSNFAEIRLMVRTAGTNTAEDGVVYFRLWDVKIMAENETPTATTVMLKIADTMSANFGYSTDYSEIDEVDYPLEQAAYDTDMTMDAIARDACSFGNGNAKPLAWGCTFDGTQRIFLEVQDFSKVYYKVESYDDLSITGDLTQTSQRVYGRYTDVYGQTKRTTNLEASDKVAALGGLYKQAVLDLGEMSNDQALTAATLYLAENSEVKIQTEFTVKDYIYGPNNQPIPIEEILAGRMVQVPDFRARESLIADDKRSGFHTFMLSKVEIDWDSRTAQLTPADSQPTFERYLELLARMVKQ